MSQFHNLVFEGGGIKGIAYAGALEVLEKENILSDIKRVAGTSAGAITATLLAPSSTVIGIFGLRQSAKLLILDKADLLDPEKV